MNSKKIIILTTAAFLGGALVSALYVIGAHANIFQDFYSRYVQEIPQRTTEETRQYVSQVSHEQSIIDAVGRASPSVVSIVVSKDLPIIERCPYNPFQGFLPGFEQFFGGETQFFVPCPGETRLQEIGGGSGFIISADGLIVTNKHVVADEDASYTVLTNDGNKYAASVLARDPIQDFAVLKINARGLPTLTLGDSDGIALGQTAIAIGNALGEYRNTVSVGVISGLAREITAVAPGGRPQTIRGVIQTDAAINVGNSGGPLLNLNGEVIGINTAIVSGAQNIGFAIPINQVKPAIESVRKTGRIVVPYLGVRHITVTADLQKRENLPVAHGALLRGNAQNPAIVPGSPAEKAGLKAEDIILELNGKKIDAENPLGALIVRRQSGDTVTLKVLRGGQVLTIAAVLGEFPAE